MWEYPSMYLLRSIVESDTGGPYGIGAFLFFYIVFRVASRNIGKNMQETIFIIFNQAVGALVIINRTRKTMSTDCAICYVSDINFLLPSLVSAAGVRRFVAT
jgi:hypothetical protein